jgi:hypothetical protein
MGASWALTSRTAIALLAAVLVNAWLGIAHPLAHVPTLNLDTGEVASCVRAYNRDVANKPPNVPLIAFMGSSLMLAPVMQAEANYLGAPVSRMNHRRIAFLERELQDATVPPPQVACLAIGGEMVSDDYLLVKNVLDGKRRPQLIVLGLGPRDFQDNILPGLQSTETFKTLATAGDVMDFSTVPGFHPDADVFISKLSPLWTYRSDVRTYMLLRGKKLMEACLPWVVFDKYGETLELKPRRHGQFPEEVHGTPMVLPNTAMMHATPEATRLEYIRRYNPLNQALIDQQFNCLRRLFALCRQRHIDVCAVNMPLSRSNVALIPGSWYPVYLARLQTLCRAHGVRLVDMNAEPYGDDHCFADGVHLSAAESARFLSDLCHRISSSQTAESARRI